ncbi:hypothetical protein [Luteipulveratus halotolerans]|uniref:hypothetical protein n=1 Tax=Luteipulveratus halotolerans TaxID=1631356 RepID=UPI0006824CF2|nr:hypothetical protein [Luteipulveratus halotolerans]
MPLLSATSSRTTRTGLSVTGAGLLLVAAVGCSSDSDDAADSTTASAATSAAASSSAAGPTTGGSSASASSQAPSSAASTSEAPAGGPVGAAVKDDNGLKNLATKAGCTSAAVKKPKPGTPLTATVASGVECSDAAGKDFIIMRTKQPGTTEAVGKAFQQQSSAGKPAYLHGDDWILLKDGSGPQGLPLAKDYEPVKAKVGGTIAS